jgi:hypothetical protein
MRALLYATHVHGGQVRKATFVPYIAHLLAVAATVLEYNGSEDMAIAALLHDAVEDQGGEPRLSDIRNRFGDRVADIVRPARTPRVTLSASADPAKPDADCEHYAAADDNLDDGVGEPAAHEAKTDEGDCEELTHDDRVSELQRDAEIRYQEGKGMEHAAKTGGDACDRTAAEGATAASDAAIVGQSFGEAHADGSAKRRCKPHKEGTQGPTRQARCGEDRRQGRDRAIHQS